MTKQTCDHYDKLNQIIGFVSAKQLLEPIPSFITCLQGKLA